MTRVPTTNCQRQRLLRACAQNASATASQAARQEYLIAAADVARARRQTQDDTAN